MAKYQKWIEPEGLTLLEGWARDGLTEMQIAKNMGVGYTTFREWKEKYPIFLTALKKGKEVVDYEVESILLKRARGYEYEEVTTEIMQNGKKHIKKIKRHVPPDTTAAIFWLKNRRPDKWRDHPEIKIEDNEDFTRASEILKGIDSAIN